MTDTMQRAEVRGKKHSVEDNGKPHSTETPTQEEIAGEMDVARILRELYRCKWVLLGVTLLAGLLTAGIMLAQPNVYTSSAALIVRQPVLPITDQTELPSVQTLQNLARSTDILWDLFEALWEKRALADWKDTKPLDKLSEFTDFQETLSAQLQKQEGREAGGAVSLLPMVILTASAHDPVEAQTVANAWSEIVIEHSQGLYTQGVEEMDVFVGGVYKQADDNLVKQEELLQAKTLEVDLDVKKARFEKTRTKAITLEGELYDLDLDIRTNDAQMKEIERRLAEREHDGVWLADAAEDLYVEGKLDAIAEANASPVAQRILRCVRTVVDQYDELMRYTTSSGLDAKQSEAKTLQSAVNKANIQISEKRLKLLLSLQEQKDVEATLAEQEVGGVWIGELLNAYYRREMNPVGLPAASEPPADPASTDLASTGKPEVTARTQRIDETVRDIVQRELALLKYREESALEFKKTRMAIFERELGQALTDRDRAQKEVVLGETRLTTLKPELDKNPEKISLDKAITDDALWQDHLEGGSGRSVETPLKTEVLNPGHQRVRDLMVDLSAETESAKQEVVFLTARETEVRGKMDALSEEIALIEMEIANRQDGIDAQRNVLEVMAAAYRADKTKLETLAVENRREQEAIGALEAGRDDIFKRYRAVEEEVKKIELRVAAKSGNVSALREDLKTMEQDYRKERTNLETLRLEQIRKMAEKPLKEEFLKGATEESEGLQAEIARSEQDLKVLELDVKKLDGVRASLATRAEEIDLLKVASVSASRMGTAVLYNAQANPQKVSPARSKIVLASMLAAFVVCGFLACSAKMLRAAT